MQKWQSGQSLVEVLIAIAVFVAWTVVIGFLVLDANIGFRQGVERTKAVLLAQEGLEAVRSLRDADFSNIPAGTHGIALSANQWTLFGSSDTQDQFSRQLTITDIAADTKEVTSTVTWQFTAARANTVALSTYLTNWILETP